MGSKNRISSKKFMQVEVDEIACAPSFVGMVSPVSEILSLVVFLQNCIGPRGQKIKLAQKFMQVEVDKICMCTKLDRHGFSSSGDFAPFHFPSNMAKFFFLTMDYIHGGKK